jgi:hypothetical protein
MEIPIFPLELVLLPGEPQQLRIFEPRYRQMLDDCLLDNEPFGVCLIDPFNPISNWSGPHLIGTLARITHHEEQGANHFIELQGQRRFRIVDIVEPLLERDADVDPQFQPDLHELLATVGEEEREDGKLYIRADVELLPELEGELSPKRAEHLLDMWSLFLDAIGKGIGLSQEILEDWAEAQSATVAQADAGALWRIASVLVHDPWARQAILEYDNIDDAMDELIGNPAILVTTMT